MAATGNRGGSGRPGRGRAGLAVGAVAVFVAGLTARSLFAADAPEAVPAQPSVPAVPAAGSAATGEAIEAAGGEHSEEGALVTAMTVATAAQEWLYLDDVALRAAVTAISTEEAGERLADAVVDEVSVARDALATAAGPVWFIASPLATRVEQYRPDRALIDVWVVTVLSAADVAVTQSAWMVTSMELVWEGEGWRVAAIDDTPGPTPQLDNSDSPWLPEQLDAELEGFTRVGAEPAPDDTTQGGG